MSTKAHAERLARAIESTGLAEPVKVNHGDDRVSVLCRVRGEGNEVKWVAIVKNILTTALDEAKEVHAWQAHICRNYFIRESEDGDRKLVWGWNVSIQSHQMSDSLDVISKVIRGQQIRSVSNRELQEFPLQGGPGRNTYAKGKGIHTVGGSQGDFSPNRKP